MGTTYYKSGVHFNMDSFFQFFQMMRKVHAEMVFHPRPLGALLTGIFKYNGDLFLKTEKWYEGRVLCVGLATGDERLLPADTLVLAAKATIEPNGIEFGELAPGDSFWFHGRLWIKTPKGAANFSGTYCRFLDNQIVLATGKVIL